MLNLKKGDVVDIIAPGFRCDIKDVKQAVKKLKSWGLNPRVPRNLFGSDVVCSNSDNVRFEHLKKALYAKDSKLIWCARGGYGSIRLLENLIKLKKPKNPKWILGYSDISSLHSFVNRRWHWPSLHGPLIDRLGQGRLSKNDESRLKQILFGQVSHVVFKGLTPVNAAARRGKVLRGKVIGGNLTVIAFTVGLPWQFDTRNKILFFEDIGERGYRVDRLLKYFEQTGFLKGVKAICFGEFVGGQEINGKSLCLPVIKRFAQEQKIPVYIGLPVGHGDRQATIPIGQPAQIIRKKKAELHVKI